MSYVAIRPLDDAKPEEILPNRKGTSVDVKANAAIAFVAVVAENGFSDCLNEVAKTAIDFPTVHAADGA